MFLEMGGDFLIIQALSLFASSRLFLVIVMVTINCHGIGGCHLTLG